MKKIFIRCDGGKVKDYGTGHITRMLSLTESLKKKDKNIKIIFLTRRNNNFHLGYEMIRKSKNNIFKCEDNNLKPNSNEEMHLFKKVNSDLIIIDRLFLSKKTSEFLVQNKIKFIVFDTKKNKFISKKNIFNLLSLNNNLTTKNLQYVILNSKLKRSSDLKNSLFISLGGIDKKRFSINILRYHKLLNNFKRVFFITREKKMFLSVKKFIRENKISDRFKIFLSPKNFYQILNKCKYSITGGGLTFIDSVISGANTLPIPEYRHQLKNINFFHRSKLSPINYKKMIVINSKKIKKLVNYIQEDKNFLIQKKKSKEYFNLNNNNNLVKIIIKYVSYSR